MKKEATDLEETDFVKMLYVTSSLLLDSPYIRLLHALVTDEVSGGDIVFYMELVPTEDGDDFQLLDDGRIDRSFYEARKARLPQTILKIADNLYSEIVRIANNKSVSQQELWKSCNFMSLKARYSKDWDNVLESEMKPKGSLMVDGVNLSFLYEKSKRFFNYDADEYKKNNLYLFMAEALYWLSCVGMCELCFYLVCMLKKSKTNEKFSDFYHPDYQDLFLNPTAKNLKRYLASVDLSKGSLQTLNQIERVDDCWVHLYNVFHPFSLLISNYENHLTWRLSARSRNFFEFLGSPNDPSNEQWVNIKPSHEEKLHSILDSENDGDGDESEQSDGYDQGDDVIKFTDTGKYGKKQKRNYDLIDAMRNSVVRDSQNSLKAFPLFNALKTYKLRGNPKNLIGYINKIAKNELSHQATKKDGVFSTEGYYREKYGVSKRTIQRAKKTIKAQRNPDIKRIESKDIFNIMEDNTMKRKHRLNGYLTQNQLCSLILLYFQKKGIKCSDTTIRNIVTKLRKSNLIQAKKEGPSYFFKENMSDLRKALAMIEKEIMKKKTKPAPPE